MSLRHDELWHKVTKKRLCLGQKIKVSKECKYYADYADETFFITGMCFKSDGESINITIGESLTDSGTDGWSVFELDIVL